MRKLTKANESYNKRMNSSDYIEFGYQLQQETKWLYFDSII
jgi:hypothetical protein